MYELVLGRVTYGRLRAVDRCVRAAVRGWMRLPRDVPLGYFHAAVEQGGLGIMALETRIPELVRSRLDSLTGSPARVAIAIVGSCWAAARRRWCSMARHPLAGWNARLHESVEGFELRETQGAWPSCAWVEDAYLSIPSGDWIKYNHIRINALPSLMRTTRGRRRAQTDERCRAGCARAETTAHIIQKCYRTHGDQVLRHDAVAVEIGCSLSLKGWSVLREKIFCTSEGNRKPDIIASRQGIVKIIDVQVVSGTRSLATSDAEKTAYYRRNADLRDGIGRLLGSVIRESDFGSVTISWRGVWAPASVTLLTRGAFRCTHNAHRLHRESFHCN